MSKSKTDGKMRPLKARSIKVNKRRKRKLLIKGYTYLGEIVPASIAMFLFLLALLEYDGRA